MFKKLLLLFKSLFSERRLYKSSITQFINRNERTFLRCVVDFDNNKSFPDDMHLLKQMVDQNGYYFGGNYKDYQINIISLIDRGLLSHTTEYYFVTYKGLWALHLFEGYYYESK